MTHKEIDGFSIERVLVLKYISENNFTTEESVEYIAEIFLHWENLDTLTGFIVNRLQNTDAFIYNARIEPLLRIINELPRKKQKILWGLLHWKAIINKNDEEKQLILSKLKEVKDLYLKIYIVNRFDREDIFTPNELKKALDFSKELNLFGFKVRSTKELMNSLFMLFEVADEISANLKDNLKKILDSFVNTEQEKHPHEELKELLSNLFNLIEFTDNEILLNLYSDYYKVEEQLLVSFDERGERSHRDHVLHSLNVFIFGLYFYFINWQIEGKHDVNDLASWILTSFYHDVGYGIQKLEQISSAIKKHYDRFGDIESAKFNLKQSFEKLGDETIDEIVELLSTLEQDDRHVAHIKTPILESIDKREHGVISAIMVRREIESMMSKNPQFSEDFSPKWEKILLRSLVAMALHTCIDVFSSGFIVDETRLKRADDIPDPIFPTLLLVLIDTIDYIQRPRFGGFYSKKQTLDIDINLNINVELKYNFKKFINVEITLEYKNPQELGDIVRILHKKLCKFYSEKWGLKITIKVPNEQGSKRESKKTTMFLLRNESEVFSRYLSNNRKNLDTMELSEVEEIYTEFINKQVSDTSKNISEQDITKVIDRIVSFQIKYDWKKSKRGTWL